MTPSTRKKLIWALSAIPASFLLAAGASLGGFGPCGPSSPFGFACFMALPVVVIGGCVFAMLFMVASADEVRKKKSEEKMPPL